MASDLPNQSALGPWHANGYADTSLPLSSLAEVPFRGGTRLLYPTQPQQYLKVYHQYDVAQYRNQDLDARDEACTISMLPHMTTAARQKKIAQARERGRRIPCLRGDKAHRLVLSDTYVDDRGNLYRGAARQEYMLSNETMGHSVSPGHTIYARRSGFNGAVDAYAGDTYPVPVEDFILLAKLLPGDMQKIARLQADAQRTHRREGPLWRSAS